MTVRMQTSIEIADGVYVSVNRDPEGFRMVLGQWLVSVESGVLIVRSLDQQITALTLPLNARDRG